MDYFGINSTDDLPKIKEVLAEQIVEATVIKPEDFTDHSVLDEVANATDKGEEEEEDANASDKGEEDANASDKGNDLSEEQDA
jgi:segregation and condensation protein B